MNPFDGSRLKIQRANDHVRTARKEIGSFLGRRPYQLIVEPDPDQHLRRLVLHQREPIPDDIALIIGDAVHNLRSALDHMACDLVRENGQPDDYVTFPIQGSKSNTKFNHILREFRAKKEVVALVRALQPYPGGTGHAVVGLYDIDIFDKHKLIVPLAQAKVQSPFDTSIVDGQTITLLSAEKPKLMHSGETYLRIDAQMRPTPGVELNATFDVVFSTGTCFAGEPIGSLLIELSDT